MIRLSRVSKNYQNPTGSSTSSAHPVAALKNVSLEITQGEFVAIMGPSGCGKSTLLHLIGGLDTPSQGEVWIDEKPIHQMSESELSLFRRHHVGIIFQFFNLLPQLTVLENTCLPLRLLGTSPSESETRAMEILSQVGLSGKEHRLPAEISGGEQQRVAISRALIHRPSLVLADEPTGNLDSNTSHSILQVLKKLQSNFDTTLILVTHAPEVSQIAQRTIHMQDGEIQPHSFTAKDLKPAM